MAGTIYPRKRGSSGTIRYYVDFRDLGLGQHALVPEGSTRATTDPSGPEGSSEWHDTVSIPTHRDVSKEAEYSPPPSAKLF